MTPPSKSLRIHVFATEKVLILVGTLYKSFQIIWDFWTFLFKPQSSGNVNWFVKLLMHHHWSESHLSCCQFVRPDRRKLSEHHLKQWKNPKFKEPCSLYQSQEDRYTKTPTVASEALNLLPSIFSLSLESWTVNSAFLTSCWSAARLHTWSTLFPKLQNTTGLWTLIFKGSWDFCSRGLQTAPKFANFVPKPP